MAIIFVHRIPKGAVWLVQDVLRVVILPEPMVDSIQSDIHELEIVPLLLFQQIPHDLELRAAHGEDLVAEPGLVIATEALDIDRIMADQLANLWRQFRRVREDVLVGIWRQETTHGDPVNSPGRITRRNADDD